ncbi:histidine kinase [Flagellimonas sp. DF-77]|uniref:sensor histidine kinase n=1 Tax=Flagellimonas algarum TaxID=3230298 RepID=UPI0033941112
MISEAELFALPIHIFMGTAFAFLLCTWAIFLYNRKLEFLWYGLYLVLLMLYFSFKSDLTNRLIYGNRTLLPQILHDSSQIGINLCYLLFSMTFLNTKENYPKFHFFLRIIVGTLSVFLVMHSLFWLLGWDPSLQKDLMDLQRSGMSLFVLFNTWYLLRYRKSNLEFFVIAASLVFALGAIMTWVSGNFHYMVYGAALENFVFSYGLGYKIKKLNTQKLAAEREAVQNQIRSLRAQMNPHFIFNALNSILGFILKGDKKESVKYLNNFSDLLRKILNTSENGSTSLEQEINLLKLYLELESLRFDKNFDYEISVDDRLDIHNLEIPILLIQPYVENAIIHGLAPKTEGDKHIAVNFTDEGEFIKCHIVDSGIGRAAALALKRKKNIYHESKGMSITKKRIELLNLQGSKEGALVSIDDLFDAEGKPSGTKVALRIYKHQMN